VSLWIYQLGRLKRGIDGKKCPALCREDIQGLLIEPDTLCRRVPPVALAVRLSETSPHWTRPTALYRRHQPEWPA